MRATPRAVAPPCTDEPHLASARSMLTRYVGASAHFASLVDEQRHELSQRFTSQGEGSRRSTTEGGCGVHVISAVRTDLHTGRCGWTSDLEPPAPLLEAAVAEVIERGHAIDSKISAVALELVQERTRRLLMNSAGFSHVHAVDRVVAYVRVEARARGRHFASRRSLRLDHAPDKSLWERLASCVELAARAAVAMLDAKPAPPGSYDVILPSGRSGIFVHEVVGHCLEADAILAGNSPYAGSLGQRIGGTAWNIVDEPLPADAGTTRSFDDEGQPAQRVQLVRRGIFQRALHDRRTALFSGVASSHNGRCARFSDPPLPRMRSTVLLSGTRGPEEILRGVRRGVYVEQMRAAGVVATTGQFTLVVSEGYLIENGKRTAPLSSFTVTGNGPEQMLRTDDLGNDSMLATGVWSCEKRGQPLTVAFGGPTLRLAALAVGGAT